MPIASSCTTTETRAPQQSHSKQTRSRKKVRLCQVAGSDAVHTHAVEKTHTVAVSLNPSSVFVVVDCVRHRRFV